MRENGLDWSGFTGGYWCCHPDRKVLNSKVNDLRQQTTTNSELQTKICLLSLSLWDHLTRSLWDHLTRKSLIQVNVYRKWISFRTKKGENDDLLTIEDYKTCDKMLFRYLRFFLLCSNHMQTDWSKKTFFQLLYPSNHFKQDNYNATK